MIDWDTYFALQHNTVTNRWRVVRSRDGTPYGGEYRSRRAAQRALDRDRRAMKSAQRRNDAAEAVECAWTDAP